MINNGENESTIMERRFVTQSTSFTDRSLRNLTSKARVDFKNLAWFLAVGFVPETGTLFDGISCCPARERMGEDSTPHGNQFSRLVTKEFLKMSEEELVPEGIHRWRESVGRSLENVPGEPIVPLSGGLDSRAILATLLDHFDASQIRTYTFGTPGTFDYDIGCKIANHVGTIHKSYDLTKYNYTQERLECIADLCDGSCDLFCHAPYEWIVEDFGSRDVTYWTGFTGRYEPFCREEEPLRATSHEIYRQKGNVAI